jgi:hypothetical protein
VVVVVVGQEDPAHVGGIDHGEHLLEPVVAHERGAGVDDDGLAARDDEAVDADERARRRLDAERRHEPRVGGDGLDGGGEQGRRHGPFLSLVQCSIHWNEVVLNQCRR